VPNRKYIIKTIYKTTGMTLLPVFIVSPRIFMIDKSTRDTAESQSNANLI